MFSHEDVLGKKDGKFDELRSIEDSLLLRVFRLISLGQCDVKVVLFKAKVSEDLHEKMFASSIVAYPGIAGGT